MSEVWKDIKGYEGKYQVSNRGKIRSLVYGNRIRKTVINNRDKYEYVSLFSNKVHTHKVHRLVAETFIPNPNNYKEVNHKDENTLNNCVSNLEWCDTKYNINYGQRTLKATKKLSKPIIQLDLENNLIKEWDSIRNASRNLNINISNISRCCKGKFKTAGGYIWKYKK